MICADPQDRAAASGVPAPVEAPYRRLFRNSSNVLCLPAASANCAVANEKLKSAACSASARSA